MKNIFIAYKTWIILIIVAGIGIYLTVFTDSTKFAEDDSWKTYTNPAFGFSLRYPPNIDIVAASTCESGQTGVCSLMFDRDFSIMIIDSAKIKNGTSRIGDAFTQAASKKLGKVEARFLRIGTEQNGRNTYYVEEGSVSLSITQLTRGVQVEKDIEQVIASLDF